MDSQSAGIGSKKRYHVSTKKFIKIGNPFPKLNKFKNREAKIENFL